MSIFKQSFPHWIQDQLDTRQKLQASGIGSNNFKSNEALVWQQNRQCTIKAISLVNYKNNVGLELDSSFNQLKGAELAKRFILQGGVLNNGNTRGQFSDEAPAFGLEGAAYGDPLVASDGHQDGYGIVPMPGITSLDIKTKSAYGSLRQAKLSFVVHNLRQLEIMEMLYMRPGYPVIVEWGWAPYIDNNGNIVGYPDSLTSTIDKATGVKDYLFQDGVDQQAVYSSIIKLKKSSFGNADAFMGFVSNFGYQARPDGGFDCFSEIVSMGEALDSLKIRPIKSALGSEFGEVDIEFKVEETEEEIKNPDALKAILLALGKFTGVIGTQGAEEPWLPQFAEFKDNSDVLVGLVLNAIENKFPRIASYDTVEEKEAAILQYILRKYQTLSAGDFNSPINTGYIRWDLLVFLINEFIIPKTASGDPSIEITTQAWINNPVKRKKELIELKYASIENVNRRAGQYIGTNKTLTDLSCDPGVCILPHSWFDETLQKTIGAESLGGKILEGGLNYVQKKINRTINSFQSTAIGNWLGEDAVDIDDFEEVELSASNSEKLIGNIFLNVDMLLEAYDSSVGGSSDPDLGSFIKAVWDKVNEACPLHNFIFKIDEEFSNKAYIMDLPVDTDEIAEIEDEIFVVEVQSGKSVVREYNLEARIPDALKATVAVHAQDPTSAQDVDDVTFKAFNRAIENRLYFPPVVETPEEKEARLKREAEDAARPTPEETLIKEFNEAYIDYEKYKQVYFQIINYDKTREVEDTGDRVKDLKTTLKTLHTSINQLNSLALKSVSTSAVIPLEFNLTFDGISNIVIGCVFKIKEDRLPRAYRSKSDGGANVGFIVFSEEQSITSGQDWVTKIGGKMIMLPKKIKEGSGQGTGQGKGAGTRPVEGVESLNETNPRYTDNVELLQLKDPEGVPTDLPTPELQTDIEEIPDIISGGEVATLLSELEDIDDPNPATPEIITSGPIEETIIEEGESEIVGGGTVTSQAEVFERFSDIDQRYFVVRYKLNKLLEATWDSGTNIFAEQINELKSELIPIVDEFERFRPQLEDIYGTEWDAVGSRLEKDYKEEYDSTVINIDINGQAYRPFITSGGRFSLSRDTADTFLNDIFTLGGANVE